MSCCGSLNNRHVGVIDSGVCVCVARDIRLPGRHARAGRDVGVAAVDNAGAEGHQGPKVAVLRHCIAVFLDGVELGER